MSPYALSIMLSSLAMGTMLVISSSHWLLTWLGLEINTLAIVPLLNQQLHPRSTEATMKYFLTQTLASALILFSATMNAWLTGQWEIKELLPMPANMMTIALAMKLGLAPMHFWLPEVLQGINLTTGLILSTWQKIAPMMVIYLIFNSLNQPLLMTMAMLSTIIGGWSGLNQTQLRKIMAYSSIAHLGWMMAISAISPNLMLLNFFIYMIMTTSMFLMMKYLKTTSINMLSLSRFNTPMTAISSLTLLSLGGLPPTTGFIPKWLILQELTKQQATTIATILAISSLLSLFFYLRLTYTMTMTNSPNLSTSMITWRHNPNQMSMLYALMTVTAILLLPLMPNILPA
uniref:NADH-ubiquinone oxidoreductase chain 2 n=1 Tax=Uraeotyphlus cf. oxyurus MW-212 TaxID=262585 RepID=Q64JP4_9AMPH|nr:NADH dehydrogenase subunit 2 [Uraeotyphlus cf. oxyurus MW-212]AAS13745.1 NADH dehydrogenase subunit 2 [Uraeotyphlus cf. oxyurus MW-212]